MELAKIEQAVAAVIERRAAPDEKFYEFVSLYEARLSSLTGIAPDTLGFDGDPELADEYWDDMWKQYLTGADAIDLADDAVRHRPSEFRKGQPAAEEFRKAWLEEWTAEERALEALEIP
jgi:hypothetical protein